MLGDEDASLGDDDDNNDDDDDDDQSSFSPTATSSPSLPPRRILPAVRSTTMMAPIPPAPERGLPLLDLEESSCGNCFLSDANRVSDFGRHDECGSADRCSTGLDEGVAASTMTHVSNRSITESQSSNSPLFVSPSTPASSFQASNTTDPETETHHVINGYLSQFEQLSDAWRTRLRDFFCTTITNDDPIDTEVYILSLRALTTESCTIVSLEIEDLCMITDAKLLQAGLQESHGHRFAVLSVLASEAISVAIIDTLSCTVYTCGMDTAVADRLLNYIKAKFLHIPTKFDVSPCATSADSRNLQTLLCLQCVYRVMIDDLTDWTKPGMQLDRLILLKTILKPFQMRDTLQKLKFKKRQISSLLEEATAYKQNDLSSSILRLPSYQDDIDDPSLLLAPHYKRTCVANPSVAAAFDQFTSEPEQRRMLQEAWDDRKYNNGDFADYKRFRAMQMMMSFATPQTFTLYLQDTVSIRSNGNVGRNLHVVHKLLNDIHILLREQNASASQLRRSYLELYVQHKARVVERQAEMEANAKLARKGLAKANPAGKSAENTILREYQKHLHKTDYADFKRYVTIGEVLKIIADCVGTTSVICLFPCDSIQSRLKIKLEGQAPHWTRKDVIKVDEYVESDVASTSLTRPDITA